jgi:3-oxoacyl-[acyl-carrier protein] reductase
VKATAVRADVSKVADIDRLFGATIEQFGRMDIVVANAGIEVVGTPIADINGSGLRPCVRCEHQGRVRSAP